MMQQNRKDFHTLTVFNIGSYPKHNDEYKIGMSFLKFGQMVFSAYGDIIDSICMERTQYTQSDKDQLVPEVKTS